MKKTALITGSVKNIGRAIALSLAGQGCNIAVHYNKSKDAAEKTAKDIKQLGVDVILVQGDVTSFDSYSAIIEKVMSYFGTVDILVNNVGEFCLKPATEHSIQEWENIIGTNFSAVFYGCKLVSDIMKKQHYGRIINLGVAGCDSVRGYCMTGPYTAAKTASLVLTKTLAKELAPYNITVNMISPGIVENSPGADPESMPAGRVARYEDITSAVKYLVSDEAEYITGSNLNISGGWNL